MEPLRRHHGKVAVLDRLNVDTDQIIPKQFLKRVERSGFGQYLFYDWRHNADGTPNPQFEWSDGSADGASILVAGENFGCGSSREHAAWALSDYGFRVILAPSFADIFYNNCFKNGVLPIALPREAIATLFEQARAAQATKQEAAPATQGAALVESDTAPGGQDAAPGAESSQYSLQAGPSGLDAGVLSLTVDLESQTVSGAGGFHVSFDVDPFRRKCLLEGLDDIGLTMQWEDEIHRFEDKYAPRERYELFSNCYLNFE
ncbi:3-isopropylmalate dehydratase small subunit [Alicyclobacillus curvatus]|nr:3-isopropylmalate dehydratase small subunit [Alicyclobacillus curvatus]